MSNFLMITLRMPTLDEHDQELLRTILAQARQGVPLELSPLFLGHQPLGFLSPQHAQGLATWLPVVVEPGGCASTWAHNELPVPAW